MSSSAGDELESLRFSPRKQHACRLKLWSAVANATFVVALDINRARTVNNRADVQVSNLNLS